MPSEKDNLFKYSMTIDCIEYFLLISTEKVEMDLSEIWRRPSKTSHKSRTLPLYMTK